MTYQHIYVIIIYGDVIMGTNLKRTTIFLTENQHEQLRRIAFESRTTMAELLRSAAMEIIEDKEDINAGLESLYDAEGTVSWKEYLKSRQIK